MKCLQDLYENFGNEYLIVLNTYQDKSVNSKYYSKIDISSDAKD